MIAGEEAIKQFCIDYEYLTGESNNVSDDEIWSFILHNKLLIRVSGIFLLPRKELNCRTQLEYIGVTYKLFLRLVS